MIVTFLSLVTKLISECVDKSMKMDSFSQMLFYEDIIGKKWGNNNRKWWANA